MRPRLALALLLTSCGESGLSRDPAGGATVDDRDAGDARGPADLAAPDLPPEFVDRDGDGLDDALEVARAAAYLPYLSLSPGDGCETMGIVLRVRPHPGDPALLHILYDQLYDRDCGAGGHPGDNEVFALTVDPSRPPPDGIVAMKAISHQGTLCERVSACGRCPGQKPCDTLPRAGVPWPAVWPSRGKHGSYVNRESSCTLLGTCFDACEDNPAPRVPAMVNAGEPGRPLLRDLTTEGFITDANGWKSQALFHHDPWGAEKFGNAGSVAEDLVDAAFDTPACR